MSPIVLLYKNGIKKYVCLFTFYADHASLLISETNTLEMQMYTMVVLPQSTIIYASTMKTTIVRLSSTDTCLQKLCYTNSHAYLYFFEINNFDTRSKHTFHKPRGK